jgi:hypothetical protein
VLALAASVLYLRDGLRVLRASPPTASSSA